MGKRYKTSETTCQAISGALKQLMTQKPLERITVAEIMDTCGMRRQHFYYYFTDIYDLLRRYAGEGMSILIASDDVREVETLCNRVLVLRGGRVSRFLTGAEITQTSLTEAAI